ncbi:MAG: alpha/beta fold hydrolase [Chloroflexi bacterium]|nr:alpha/beta fold hydrolase [Chloroflexota bacterium]
MPQTIPTAEPFFLPGDASKPACLLVHGFTGTPKEMRWMGDYLHAQGHTCLGVRLAGHATRPKDMIRSQWTDWTASVEDGYNILRGALSLSKRGVTDNIFLVGLSMGGVLSLLMSTRVNVKGVVAMSTPFTLPANYPAWGIRLFSFFQTYRKKSKGAPGEGWFDKDAFQGHVSYPLNPIRSAAELQTMFGRMRLVLPKIQVPVLLIHSKDDPYVPPDSMPNIYERLNPSLREMLWVTGSGHVVTRDAARQQVFEAAAAFIQKVESKSN